MVTVIATPIPDKFNIVGIYITGIVHKMASRNCIIVNKPVKFQSKFQGENLTKLDIIKLYTILLTDNTNTYRNTAV
jgi:hypothetical protein